MAWLVIASSVASALRDDRPTEALRLMHGDARAQARAAELVAFGENGLQGRLPEARALALTALSHDATLANAWRTLALIGVHGPLRSPDLRMLSVAANLSRRDTPTQLALIELLVQRGDVAASLRHYDVALRVAPRNDPILLPILVHAAAEPAIRDPLAARLVKAPQWRRRFFTVMANLQVQPQVYADLLAAMRRHGPLADADIFRNVAGVYAQLQQYGPAWSIYRSLQPRRGASIPLIRNGSFVAENLTPPFDWQLLGGQGLDVDEAHQAGAGSRLEINSARGDSGVAARQLLMLVPGRYALSYRFGALPATRLAPLYSAVLCVDPANTPAIRPDDAPSAPGRRVVGVLRVPGGCRTQSLEFGLRAASSDAATGVWIGDVELTRLPGT